MKSSTSFSLFLLLCLFQKTSQFFISPSVASSYSRRSPAPSSSLLSCNSPSNPPSNPPTTQVAQVGLRLNKCFKRTHSRRAADALIAADRVLVNGQPPNGAGHRVQPSDIVTLDGVEYDFQEFNTDDSKSPYVYVKYNKPLGTICTSDRTITDNIISALRSSGLKLSSRIYPIGRLDKDSHGLILLSNDGRIPNSVLRSEKKKSKIYHVTVDRYIEDYDLAALSAGVVITTVAQRDKVKKPLTAPTLPCSVKRLGLREFKIVLNEGRNRQIRKMCEALDYDVVELQRTEFMGITLDNLEYGEWKYCSDEEINILKSALNN